MTFEEMIEEIRNDGHPKNHKELKEREKVLESLSARELAILMKELEESDKRNGKKMPKQHHRSH